MLPRAKSHICFVVVIAALFGCVPFLPVTPEGIDNVVLVVIDATAARHLSTYGNDRPTSPHLDSLAREGVLFEQAYAQASWTLPSAASYLTGRYPPVQGQIGKAFLGRSIATVMIEQGLRTAAFSENPFVTRTFGMDTGFEVFEEYFPFAVVQASPHNFGRIDTDRTVNDALSWVDQHLGERFFLYVHLLPPHSPYSAPEPFAGRFDPDYAGGVSGDPQTLYEIDQGQREITGRDLEHLKAEYHENIAFADHQVGRFVEELRQRQLLDSTMLIITSDHGEAFMEHGRLQHNWTVYEEMVHVPLIVRFPPEVMGFAIRWPGLIELIDLFPTICEAVGATTCGEGQGRSLFASLRQGPDRRRVVRTWTSLMQPAFGGLRLGRYKLVQAVETGQTELYDLKADPGETTNLAPAEPARTAALQARLNEAPAAPVEIERADELAPETLERLRALGYLQ